MVTVMNENNYEALRSLVRLIAHDYVELSHDKVAWQLNDYRQRARALDIKINHDELLASEQAEKNSS